MDTIYALSTPAGRGGIAVIRASGPAAWGGLSQLTKDGVFPPRVATLAVLRDPVTADPLDHGIVIAFEGPNSFTGENVVEYHVHGGIAVVDGVLSALSRLKGHRLAEPGEFTRRAFLNGRIDLTAAEAIADLIHAETEAQKLQALDQMGGSLFHLYEDWKDRVAKVLALMEADLDFSDQDLPEDILLKIRPQLDDVRDEIRTHLDDGHKGERLRDGFRLVILGAPNAGKSSLVNALTRRDVAIVSSVAGTTRDMIETHLNLGGYPVILTDTAGLRGEAVMPTDDHRAIEAEGVRRALGRAAEADLKILLFDATRPPDAETLALMDDNSFIVINKIDAAKADWSSYPEAATRIEISVQDGTGMPDLQQAMIKKLQSLVGTSRTPSLTRARHRECLDRALLSLERSLDAPLPELAAEDLRLALRDLGRLTGRVDVEDLLDMIFRDFCIGK